MKRKYEIWFAGDLDETGMLIPVGEIEQKIATFGDAMVYRLDEVATDERIEELNRAIENWAKDHENNFCWWRSSDAEEFFDENGIEYAIHSDEYYSPSGNIVFCHGKFYNENYFDTFPIYTWWDGSNWKQVERSDEYGEITELEYDEDAEECLDEWDGSNYTSGYVGIHHYMVRLGEDRVLMIYRSQWHGDHTGAEILTDAQYTEYRKERGMDE